MNIEICKKCLNSDNVKFKIYTPELDKDIEIIDELDKNFNGTKRFCCRVYKISKLGYEIGCVSYVKYVNEIKTRFEQISPEEFNEGFDNWLIKEKCRYFIEQQVSYWSEK